MARPPSVQPPRRPCVRSTTTSGRGWPTSTHRCSPWSAGRRAPASPPSSTHSSAHPRPGLASSGRPPGSRSSCTPRWMPAGSRRIASCPGLPGSAGASRRRARRRRRPETLRPLTASTNSCFSPTTGCRRRWRSSTRRTSIPSPTTTAPSPPSCSLPPTCGSSSRPRTATPTRCRGDCSTVRRRATSRSRSC